MQIPKQLRRCAIAAGLITSASLAFGFAVIAAARAQSPQPAAVAEDASALLGRMSKTLMTNQFSFRAKTLRAYVGANGELLHIGHTIKTVVRRPDKFFAEATGDDGSVKIFYDGKALVIYTVDQKQYVRVPVSGKIEEVLEVAKSRMGVDFPLEDLLAGDVGKSILAGVTAGGPVGTVTVDGVKCSHLFFIQPPDLDLELWVEENEQALLRRVFVTYRTLPGHPTFVAELSDWNLSAQPPEAEFVFTPPAGVREAGTADPAK